MIKKIGIYIYLFICFMSFAENSYIPTQIKIIPYSTKEEELGYNIKDYIPGAGNPRPLDYVISDEGIIYVYDWANHRIVEYDLTLTYLRTIKSKKVHFGFMYSMNVDENKIIYIKDGYGIYKYDSACNQLGFISDKLLSTTAIAEKNYFTQNGNLFYYNDDFTLSSIDQDGKKQTKEETEKAYKTMGEKKRLTANANDIDNYDIIDSFNKQHKPLFFKGKRLYINNKKEYLDYIKFAQDKNKKEKSRSVDNKKNITNKDYVMVELLGYDDADNAYWQSDNSILIISPLGEIVENVGYDAGNYLNPKIAPNGDIYFWNVKPEGTTFYKITRRW